jgi:hypothetical protein
MDGGIMEGRWRGVGDVDGDDPLRIPVPAGCQNGVSDLWIGVSGGGGAAELLSGKDRTPSRIGVEDDI